jgi:hypothetical protein
MNLAYGFPPPALDNLVGGNLSLSAAYVIALLAIAGWAFLVAVRVGEALGRQGCCRGLTYQAAITLPVAALIGAAACAGENWIFATRGSFTGFVVAAWYSTMCITWSGLLEDVATVGLAAWAGIPGRRSPGWNTPAPYVAADTYEFIRHQVTAVEHLLNSLTFSDAAAIAEDVSAMAICDSKYFTVAWPLALDYEKTAAIAAVGEIIAAAAADDRTTIREAELMGAMYRNANPPTGE